jgi:ATP-dependent Clp protease ATP-binding subunit ClpB
MFWTEKSCNSEIEIEAIKREKTTSKLKVLGMELANLKKTATPFTANGNLKDVVDNVSVKTEIEDYKYEAERAERDGDYGKVAEIRYGKSKKPKSD